MTTSPARAPRPMGDMPIASRSRHELIALFRWYGFTDAEGHPLTNCLDFQELLDRACGATSDSGDAAVPPLFPPLLIELHEVDCVRWIVSVGGYNPEPSEGIWCANREEAERCVDIFSRLLAPRRHR